jgi:uncharacterized membrane protein
VWGVEALHKEQAQQQLIQQTQQLALEQAKQEAIRKERQKQIEYDENILKEDQNLTNKIEKMMIQYGMLHYTSPSLLSLDDQVNQLFEENRRQKQRQKDDSKIIGNNNNNNNYHHIMTSILYMILYITFYTI